MNPGPIPFVGIDDIAFKKRFSYGTVFIDLETGHPVNMISSTDSTAVAQWISTHPEINLITVDGSRSFAKAVRDASPAILQVADQWHVLHQLFDASKKTIYDCLLNVSTTCTDEDICRCFYIMLTN
ncbi:transposase [Sporosarcina sp. ACRSM]|uniref:transposase n=1 Tax=Sporosarcina sp. ACRSM TaxID=2918216 RepID=UPI00351D92A3